MFLEFNKFLSTAAGQDFIFVNSKGSCSHNFIISHLLINAAKKNQSVNLICCGESAQFFSLVSQRAGLPFRQLVEKGLLRFTCLVSRWRTEAGVGQSLSIPKLEVEADLVIIDDLLPLLDISSFAEVVRQVYDVKAKSKSMLVIGLRTDDSECERLSKIVRTMSHMCVDIYPLSTGYSRDVHGVIELSSIKPIEGSTRQKMHFKITERGAKLLVIGSHIAIT